MNIVTTYVCPPLPIRSFDWMAYDADTFDGEEGNPVGYGRTEAEAIANLKEQLAEAEDEPR